jgi:hypothetical protein
MANIKISDLGASTPIIGTESLPLVQGGTTRRATTQDVARLSANGYSQTKAFAGKPLSNGYVWPVGEGITYTQAEATAGTYKVLSLDSVVQAATDNPYWSDPVPVGTAGIGLFQGAHLPEGATRLFDYTYDYDTNYPTSSGTGYEGSTGRLYLNELKYGDKLVVRFDFNIIPQIANTTVEFALWYSNRDATDAITYTFPLAAQPIFYGEGTVGNTYLNRTPASAWIASSEDTNALALPAIKADNPVIIQPIGMLASVERGTNHYNI